MRKNVIYIDFVSDEYDRAVTVQEITNMEITGKVGKSITI